MNKPRLNKPFFYVANWKMYISYKQISKLTTKNYADLATLSLSQKYRIIICPSFVSLHKTATSIHNSQILLGAQDCSEHPAGAFTGQVSAQSLAEIGCSYCIIGHSEQRQYFNNKNIEEKALRLLEQKITPILCVGKTDNQDLAPIITIFDHFPEKGLIIAYEPIESIGTGKTPTNEHIEQIAEKIHAYIKQHKPNSRCHILYGGSVSNENIKRLKKIAAIDGFLIGGASTHLDDFKEIIES